MKSNSFAFTTAIVLIAHCITWILLTSSSLLHWRHKFLNWHFNWQRKRRHKPTQTNMYEFRPFELQHCDYRKYNKRRGRGHGINFIPKKRSGHRIVANETDLFSFGGYNQVLDERLFHELLKFNFLTQKWCKVFTEKTEHMPVESVSNALTIKDNCLVLYGGTGYPFGENSSNEAYLMWPYGMHSIERLDTTGEKPEQLYGQAIMVQENFLYVLGGTSGHVFTCDIHRLNLINRVWEKVYHCNHETNEKDPEGRYRHEIAHDDDHIYIFGGGTQDSSFPMNVIPAFSISQNKFVSIATKADPTVIDNDGYPEARRFFSLVQHSTDNGIEVVIAGGFNSPTRFLDDIWKFNLQTHQWQLLTQSKLPKTLYFHDAAAVGNGLMYIFGGVEGSDGERTNNLHKMWVHIPKLSEMCWDALTFYDPKLADRSKEELLCAGVPRKFAERAVHGRSNGVTI